MNARFVILDTETTGFDPDEHRLVEFAAIELKGNNTRVLFDTLLNPERDIPPEASAVHHITASHVEGKPTLAQFWPEVEREIRREENTVLVAHNAAFDRSFLPPIEGIPWLCTYRLARHIWASAPSHSNQVLRYWPGIDVETGAPHRALADIIVTSEILKRALQAIPVYTVEELVAFANKPILVTSIPFGKLKGKL